MNLSRLLAPSSIAVVGATDRAGSYGSTAISNLVGAGFSGQFARGFAMGPGGSKFNGDANGEIEALFAEQQDVATTMENLQSRAEETITLGGGGAATATPEA